MKNLQNLYIKMNTEFYGIYVWELIRLIELHDKISQTKWLKQQIFIFWHL